MANTEADERATATSPFESKTLVASGSEDAVAVPVRVVAVTAGAFSAVTYTTGRTKTSEGAGTTMASTSIVEVDWAPVKAARATRAVTARCMLAKLIDLELGREGEASGGRENWRRCEKAVVVEDE